MAISFFYRRRFYHKDKRLLRASAVIRGEQIANYLGAKENPTSGFEEDVCIFVKLGLDGGITFPKNSYIDLIDSKYFEPFLQSHPEVKLIAASLTSYKRLKEVLGDHEIVLIPQHHCNFERTRRKRNEVVNAGYIGSPCNFQCDLDYVSKECVKLGMKFFYNFHFRSRKNVCDFYNTIDIQLDFRPKGSGTSNPLKIINAASFGIPTIAFPRGYYEEVEGCYLKVGNPEEMFKTLENIKNDGNLYKEYAEKCISKSEEYHIEKIAELYKKLDRSI